MQVCKANRLDETILGIDDQFPDDVFAFCPEEVVNCVRKYFCPTLRDLLQHGMLTVS